MNVRCGWKGCGSALVLFAVVGVAAISPARPAGAAANFHGVATADAIRVTLVVPNAPATSSIVDGGAWSAQAVVTSAGTSQAYASNPYPGDTVVSLPGTLAGFGAPGVPPYPLYAASMHPDTKHAEIGNGPFHLVADSTAVTSDASASSGQSGEQKAGVAAATASVHQEGDGGVVSRSESRIDGFAAGPLKIASIVSGAITKLPPGGELERSSHLDVSGLAVNDAAVRLTPQGLVVADKTVPVDPKAIAEALAKAGVSIAYVAPEETPNGIIGAGVRVTSSVQLPGSGTSQATWIFGRSLALIDSAQGDTGVLPEVGSTDVPFQPPSPSTSAEPAPPAASSADSSAFSAGLGSLPSPAAGGLGSYSSSPSGETAARASAPTGPGDGADAAAGQAAFSPAPRVTAAKPASASRSMPRGCDGIWQESKG